ncbi:hypothetical protein L1987_15342 [Smallanthus sonchifolius]|uniref:Uncharacterized protein n=1 Tax=Smallanthus sonchifolius TaxID=185202 RepID=A0ACB9J578_9ASTR|nr:hypothetical protein L1987_15342 [Smallanthus sonchifolius]
MVYSDESDDEYFDEAKVEGIPIEVKKEDSKVDSNSSGNYTFRSSSNSRRVPYVRDYKDRRTCFHCNEMGHIVVKCPYKNKGKKHVVPEKMKPESKPVEKIKPKEVHVGESSSSASYCVKIPYMRDYRETRSCFYCGLVGHIRIACPHNAKGNRHVTPGKVRTHGKPYVNPNVVKPRDTPRGNSKSEVRLSRPQRRRRNRRRRNRRLKKLLEQQELSQSKHFSNDQECSNTSHFTHKQLND